MACSRLVEFLFPRTCLHCGCLLTDNRGGYTCRRCRELIEWIPLGRGPEGSRSMFKYAGPGARLVHALKYEGGVWIQKEVTALAGEIPWVQKCCQDTVLVPVPLHPGRFRSRGYNQAGIIAEGVREAVFHARVQDCLMRTRKTPSQTLLSREERLRNMRGAFVCKWQLDDNQRYTIVDDVLTTGATLQAARIALEKAGAVNISAFTLAHG